MRRAARASRAARLARDAHDARAPRVPVPRHDRCMRCSAVGRPRARHTRRRVGRSLVRRQAGRADVAAACVVPRGAPVATADGVVRPMARAQPRRRRHVRARDARRPPDRPRVARDPAHGRHGHRRDVPLDAPRRPASARDARARQGVRVAAADGVP